jgi:hypothetical protein
MARGYTIDFSKTIGSLDKLSQQILQRIDDELDANSEDIATNARADVPKGAAGGGGLEGSISVLREKFLQRTVVANVFYAPFVEFGTGQFAASYVATLPSDIQEYAMSFFVSGLGHMPAAPFMFPNIIRQLPILTERIVQVVNDL